MRVKHYTHHINVNKAFLKGLSKDKKIFLQEPSNTILGPILSSDLGFPNLLTSAIPFSSTQHTFCNQTFNFCLMSLVT